VKHGAMLVYTIGHSYLIELYQTGEPSRKHLPRLCWVAVVVLSPTDHDHTGNAAVRDSMRPWPLHMKANHIDQSRHLANNLVRTTRKRMKRKPANHRHLRSGNRWRLQDAKARLSEVVRQAQQRGPQRVTVHGRDAVVVVRADEFDRMRRPISGHDIVVALAASPLADVPFERLTITSRVRDVRL
jgi:prevent-host-death family protein